MCDRDNFSKKLISFSGDKTVVVFLAESNLVGGLGRWWLGGAGEGGVGGGLRYV